MKLIVGLGNPGSGYQQTRHNIGFMVIDQLTRRFAPDSPLRSQFQALTCEVRINSERCLLVKPMTYMNLSGASVSEAARFFRIDPGDMLIICDDTALPLGNIRIRPGGSDGGHNGLADIHRRLGTDTFPRLRIGIGKSEVMAQKDYVLGGFTREQQEVFDAKLPEMAAAALCWATEGIATAMNRYNTRREAKNRKCIDDDRQSDKDSSDEAEGPEVEG